MTKYGASMPKMCQIATWCTN